MNPKDIIDYLTFFLPFHKTKWGLAIGLIFIVGLWVTYVFPFTTTPINISYLIIASIFFYIFWRFDSGRFILPTRGFRYTVIFCLKAHDAMSMKYIKNSISLLTSELDKIGLLGKFRFKAIGQDVIINQKDAHCYREKKDVDLIIWGEVFSGTKEGKEVCDFNKLSFTYKIPGSVIKADLSQLFKTDINIALVNRDWNIYEINSLPDTEKISGHLFEFVMFVVGIIYSQRKEFAEESIVILEKLYNLLDSKTIGEQVDVDPNNKYLQVSSPMLRKGRILAIIMNVYKNLGSYFVESHDYNKGYFYLRKFMGYEGRDIAVLSNLAYCAFHLNDLTAAKKYTDEIKKVDKNNEIYILNSAFFGIFEKSYASALYFYKEIVKRRTVSGDIIIKVIAFLDERKSEFPNELAYDFAIGLLNYYHCQNKVGKKELEKFARHARKKSEYREIICYIESDVLPTNKRKKGKHHNK